MSSQVRVCIGVPVHNSETFLRQSLDALAGQTYRDFKVLLLDDGSTDRSREIVEDYCSRDPRFELIVQEENRRLIESWQTLASTAIEEYRPDYFAWYGDHDTVESTYDCKERSVRAARRSPRTRPDRARAAVSSRTPK